MNEPVASGDDGRVGALGVGQLKEAKRLVDGVLVRPLGEGVGRQVGLVRAADALDPEVGEVLLEGIRERRANNGALQFRSRISSAIGVMWRGGALRTMFPISVEPRAKMRMALGQAPSSPSSRSLRVVPPIWRASGCALEGADSPRGTAETRAAVARRAMSCMVKVVRSGDRRREAVGTCDGMEVVALSIEEDPARPRLLYTQVRPC